MLRLSRGLARASCFAIGIAGTVPIPAAAQQLVYTPVNPTFGGNPFNSAHLLGVAGGQNDYKDPSLPPTPTPLSQGDLFAQQLRSMLLSSLAQQVTEAVFGDHPQQNGTITFGSQTISFTRTLESVLLNITDTATGQVTNVTVPVLRTTG